MRGSGIPISELWGVKASVRMRATLVSFGWFVALVLFAELLGDGDGEVGEIDVLILRTGPTRVAACSPKSVSDYRT